MNFYSDEVSGLSECVELQIPLSVWAAIAHYIKSLLERGAFGYAFPITCQDGGAIIANNHFAMQAQLQGAIPKAYWPLDEANVPDTVIALDIIQFCYSHVAKPSEIEYHKYFGHHHLRFDKNAGQEEFLVTINTLFRRNSLAYKLQDDGRIVRLVSNELSHLIQPSSFSVSDAVLEELMYSARSKFSDPDIAVRKDALEKLWDAWERAKTILHTDKQEGSRLLLDRATTEPAFRALLETEALALTRIGNNFQIRHSETSKTSIRDSKDVDYLFHRMLALIYLLLK